MKLYFNILFFAVAIIAGLSGCKKDETQVKLNVTGASVTLVSDKSNLVLLQNEAANDALTFNWDAAEFGYPAAVTYTLQFAKKGTDFANIAQVVVGKDLSKSFTGGVLNQKLLEIISYEVETDISVRVKATVAESAPVVYSNVLDIKITLYHAVIDYPFPKALWVAGNYQGWNPGAAPKIVDKDADGQTGKAYEGYINFVDGAPHEFKLVKGNDWGFGDFGSPAPGVLSNGGNNLSIPTEAGVYLLKANTADLNWSYTLIKKWAVTGSATPLGWPAGPEGTPGQDHTMNFDPMTGVYSITLNLSAGELKFRANDAWSLNFGDNENDNYPDYGGNNIVIGAAGNYTITLDLSVAGNYAYTIKKN